MLLKTNKSHKKITSKTLFTFAELCENEHKLFFLIYQSLISFACIVETEVDLLKYEHLFSMGSKENPIHTVSTTDSDLKDELSCLYSKHLSTIPVPPLLKKLDLRVDDFYMELEICEDQEYESKSNKDSKQAGKNIVRNYKDIFYKEKKRVENIYVLGDAGVGKSTWCLKLIDTWLKANKPEGKSTNETSLNEKLMLQFEVVLFVSLRHASKEMDLIDMIRNQIFLQTPDLLVDTQEVLKAEPEKCLVIIDGLDEWNPPDEQMSSPLGQDPSFPGRKDMNHCTVLTTTRPWKLDEIRSSCSFIDRAVAIRGFINRDISDFAGKVIKKLNQKTSTEIASNERHIENIKDFEMEVQKRFHTRYYFPDLMKIPFIVIFMVLKWFKDGSLESTMAGNYSSLLENMLEHEEGYRNLQPRYGQKRKYDGRLSCVPYLEEAKAEWSKELDTLPDCIKKHPICRQYSGLILKLSRIAFEGLFEKKGNTLIFIEEVLLKSLSPEELEVSVKSGLLSKTNDIGGPSIGMSKFSFLHKTVQEYMSAIYLVAHENDNDSKPFQILEKYCITYQKIYEMENVILFVCGLSTGVAKKILKHVSNVEHSRMCFNEHDRFSPDPFCDWLKELRETAPGVSMPEVPVSSIICSWGDPVKDFLDFLGDPVKDFLDFLDNLWETNTDNIKYIDICAISEICMKPPTFLFPNLTTLKLQRITLQCICTRTKFQLKSLRNLYLSDVSSKEHTCNCNTVKFAQGVLDFSESTNIEKVEINTIFSWELVFPGNKLKELKLEHLNSCHLLVHSGTAVQKTEHKIRKVSCLALRPSNSTLNCVYQRINCIDIKECVDFNLHLHSSFNLEEADITVESAQVSSLHCKGKERYKCQVEVVSNIPIESVSLDRIEKIPNIPWEKVKSVVLKRLQTTDIYIDILERLYNSESLLSLHCTGHTCTKNLVSVLGNTLESASNIETLMITGNCYKLNLDRIKHLKHLKLQGKSMGTDISGCNNVESLLLKKCPHQFSRKAFYNYFDETHRKVIYSVSNYKAEFHTEAIYSVSRLVNLRCLKCMGFTEYDFSTLGECFPFLPNLQELELSHFLWEKVKNPFIFSCLENIKNLKILSLVRLFPCVTFTVAKTFHQLELEEVKIIHCSDVFKREFNTSFLKIMQSLQSQKMLKKVTVVEEETHCLSTFISAIEKLNQIESVTLIKGNKYKSYKERTLMPFINLHGLTKLETLVLGRFYIEEQTWQAFVKSMPIDGQLQTVEFHGAEISHEETEELIKSTSVFESQEWECTGRYTYNIVLKTKKNNREKNKLKKQEGHDGPIYRSPELTY
ncbi:uncharacterized protein LOC123564910 isoform X2 [Mercenaria mercenaria]|uniref:uncharacterized protein LOC123564910 isoform X2 n=1 Tax=Mercenaria mercenaria TaxID=6596 RepID=UPI00234F9AEE|nr:uncharacterized protein LOC123564910 isoform X2 [Mercenaria mercenaria]